MPAIVRVKSAMQRQVALVGPNESVAAAARRMRDRRVGMLPVCSEERLVGVLTDGDVVARVVAVGGDPEQIRVRQVMTRHVLYCFEDDELASAVRQMVDQGVRRLAVLDKAMDLVGILSAEDLIGLASAEGLGRGEFAGH